MKRLFDARKLLTAALALTLVAPLAAQTFPDKSVRAIVPFSPGAGPDAVVRQVGEKLAREWGQPFVIENKPGANGWLAATDAKRAPADGHTLLLTGDTQVSLQPLLYAKMPFNPMTDFEPASPLYTANFFVVVGSNSPWRTVDDLIAAAKTKAGGLTYGTWGIGSVAHFGAASIEAATGTKMTHVPFKEVPQLYTAVASGDVDWAFGTAATIGGLHRAGKLKLLAYAAPKRLSGYADVPTVSETPGLENFELRTWVALYVPKGTPKAAISRIHAGVMGALAQPDVKERMATGGFVPWMATPEDVLKTSIADRARYEEIVKRTKISVE